MTVGHIDDAIQFARVITHEELIWCSVGAAPLATINHSVFVGFPPTGNRRLAVTKVGRKLIADGFPSMVTLSIAEYAPAGPVAHIHLLGRGSAGRDEGIRFWRDRIAWWKLQPRMCFQKEALDGVFKRSVAAFAVLVKTDYSL